MSEWPSAGSGDMFRLVAALPDQLRASAALAGLDTVAAAPGVRRLVLCGMGGSAIAGDLVQPLLAAGQVSLTVWRDYGLPAWTGPDDLVICASYSGHTEETLAAYAEAGRRGCRRLAIASGGELVTRAGVDGVPAVTLPGGLPPRASLGYGLGALTRVLGRLGLVGAAGDLVEAAAATLDRADAARRHPWGPGADTAGGDPDGNPPAEALARELAGRVPVIYTCGGESHAVGLRLRAQLNENSKVPALLAAFPELDHNDLVGWCLDGDDRRRFVLLILRAADEHPRTTLRVGLTRDLLAGQFAAIHELRGGGADALSRVMSLVQYGDYLSCHLAEVRQVDPVPVERIIRLKEALARAKNP
ncbi:MAG: bifunctional phosphoglucose/phosphomannose isomerase [bacterium]|nr:bifunctional phosphoglucose/phosphomannose isomerase [bacterium]